ncbi:MAG: ABC transporter ATP-binding protein [Chloroflexi bacterium]|nr:ABC transporter ATP-binding protein [Chloroflexota bacterium]
MTNRVIHTENLTKFYGKHRGLIDLNFEVRAGEVVGYLGPNGSGKSTTIRLLLDFIRPTKGRAEVFGMDVRAYSVDIRRRVGYLPGELVLYENLTGREMLVHLASLRGGVDWKYAEALAERLELDLSRSIKTLSKGNKQKVGLVQAFMHQPELLLLDEPTSGLDPLMQQEFYLMAREATAEGRTVFLSSHVLAEVERIADRVGIIREGKLVLEEEVATLKAKALRQLEMHFATSVPAEAFTGLPGVRDIRVENGIVHCTIEGSVDALVKAAAQFEVVNITSHEPDLEEIFLAYYTECDNHAE